MNKLWPCKLCSVSLQMAVTLVLMSTSLMVLTCWCCKYKMKIKCVSMPKMMSDMRVDYVIFFFGCICLVLLVRGESEGLFFRKVLYAKKIK